MTGRGPFDRWGVLAPDRYDALVPPAWRTAALLPSARRVEVLGNGGPGLFRAFRAEHAPLAGEPDPLDAWTRRQVQALARELIAEGFETLALFPWEQRGGAFADFVALGGAAGLGAPGRLGLLLHPVVGPWLAIRGLLISEQPLDEKSLNSGGPLSDFAPCRGCSAPCVDACPGGAIGADGFVVQRCAQQRRAEPEGACAQRCGARHACVLGQAEAYDRDAEAFHMAASLAWIEVQNPVEEVEEP